MDRLDQIGELVNWTDLGSTQGSSVDPKSETTRDTDCGPGKRIAVLGSTGSVGRQTLDVLAALSGRFTVFALAAGRNVSLLNEQIRATRPTLVAVGSDDLVDDVDHYPVLAGQEGLVEIATHPCVDLVVVATSGRAGLAPTLAAIRAGKKVALANKEVLVMAGALIMDECRKHGVEIYPVDSEHSALWQCMQGENLDEVKTLVLTASGGPFRTYSYDRLERVTPDMALAHPTWKMGRRVTLDSATLMNKGFEVIEAHWLFDKPYDQLDVLIHPQSIIHSMIEFMDGSVKAQLATPDMRLPIQYALTYPERCPCVLEPVDWRKIGSLTFEEPDIQRFPCLELAYEAGRRGGTYPAVLCAADEQAVQLYLQERIRFMDIPAVIEEALSAHEPTYHPAIDDVLLADQWARNQVRESMSRLTTIRYAYRDLEMAGL